MTGTPCALVPAPGLRAALALGRAALALGRAACLVVCLAAPLVVCLSITVSLCLLSATAQAEGHGKAAEPAPSPDGKPHTALHYGGTVKPEDLRLSPEETAQMTSRFKNYDDTLKDITVLLQRLEDIPPLSKPPSKVQAVITPQSILVVGLTLETMEGVKIWPNRVRIPRKDLVRRVLEMLDKAMADYEKLKDNPTFKSGNVKRIYF